MPLPNTVVNFTEAGDDLAGKYVGIDDFDAIFDYLTDPYQAALSDQVMAWGYATSVLNSTTSITPKRVNFYPVVNNNISSGDIAAGRSHLIAVKNDGTLWSIGGNAYGELGVGDTTSRLISAVQVGTLTNWKQVSAGENSSLAVKTDGTLWAWGDNTIGQLGDGTTIHRSSPVQVGALTNWKQVSVSSRLIGVVTSGSTLAVKTDGTLWAWGDNTNGQLGLNDRTHRSSPVQVGALTTWSTVSVNGGHTLAVRTNGTLWAWGFNQLGQLGDGTTTHRSSPVQIGALTNWSKVSASKVGQHSFAIKTDGTLWAWGFNNSNVLGGVGTRSSPAQLGTLTNWSQVSTSREHTLAVKTDGTLWAWGKNTEFGPLGDGTLTHRSSPVQVGTSTYWVKAEASFGFTGGYDWSAGLRG